MCTPYNRPLRKGARKEAISQERERGVELTHWQLASGPLEAGTLASADVTLCPPAPFNPNSSGSTSALMSGNSDMVSILMVIGASDREFRYHSPASVFSPGEKLPRSESALSVLSHRCFSSQAPRCLLTNRPKVRCLRHYLKHSEYQVPRYSRVATLPRMLLPELSFEQVVVVGVAPRARLFLPVPTLWQAVTSLLLPREAPRNKHTGPHRHKSRRSSAGRHLLQTPTGAL